MVNVREQQIKALISLSVHPLNDCTPRCQPLTPSVSLQPAEAISQGPLQLLGGLTNPDASLPAGFLEDLISRIETDDLPDLMVKLSKLSDTINFLRFCL